MLVTLTGIENILRMKLLSTLSSHNLTLLVLRKSLAMDTITGIVLGMSLTTHRTNTLVGA